MSALAVMQESDRLRAKTNVAIAMYTGPASAYHKMNILTTGNDKCKVDIMSDHTEQVMNKSMTPSSF